MSHQKLIHLSDLHIRTESKPEVSNFRKIASAITKYYASVPVLITGDITDSATKPQMLLARKCIEELARTNLVLCVPGNHDYAVVGNFYRREAPHHWTEILGTPFGFCEFERHWMSANCEPYGVEGIGVYEHGFCVLVGVDSGDPTDQEALARGSISKQLADDLRITLEKYPDKVRVVFLHHHPFTDDLFLELRGAKRLMAALKGNCELLLFGHHHSIGSWWGRGGIPLILASHKSTRGVAGSRLLMSVVEIVRDGENGLRFEHSLKVV